VYIGWSDPGGHVNVLVSHDMGATFNRVVLGTAFIADREEPGDRYPSDVAIAGSGDMVVAAWRAAEERTVLRISRDRGRTWAQASRLPTPYDHYVEVRDGRILAMEEGGTSFVLGEGSWREVTNPDGSGDMGISLGPGDLLGSFSFGEAGLAWRTSADGGAHWSLEVLPVTGPDPESDVTSFPSLASWLDDGTIVATYQGQLLLRR